PAGCRADVLGGRVQRPLVPREDRDVHALPRQRLRDRLADAAAAAGHERALALKLQIHHDPLEFSGKVPTWYRRRAAPRIFSGSTSSHLRGTDMNPVAWFEITAPEAQKKALQEFYASTFDWKFTPDLPNDYGMVEKPEGEAGIGGAVDASDR